MHDLIINNFGVVDEKGDAFEFTIETRPKGLCRLAAVLQSERGPRRTEVASVPETLWRKISTAAVKELVSEMTEEEREKKAPALNPGVNRMSPLVGRELGVLLIALMEEGAPGRQDALLHAWRELAREERWWLYAKAAAPGQQRGVGWRRALFHALTETTDTRTAPPTEAQKKNLWEHRQELFAKEQREGEGIQPPKAEETPEQGQSISAEPLQRYAAKTDQRKKQKTKKAKDKNQLEMF
jgi:hypothetical protein